MKLPFRSRTPVEEFDFDELDDVGLDELDIHRYGVGSEEGEALGDVHLDASIARDVAPVEYDDLDAEHPESEDPETVEPDDHYPADPGVEADAVGAVSADEFSNQMERLRSEASAEQRSAWAYLGVLTAIFFLLVLFGYVLSDARSTDPEPGTDGSPVAAGQPTQLVFRVDGDVITLEGTLPDEASKSQLLAAVQERYGAENVLDNLVVDEAFSFENGTIRMVGSAAFDDERPEALQEVVSSDFGLGNRGFEVGFVDTVLAPVNALVEVSDGRVELSGALPDQPSVDDLVGLAASVWGPPNVSATLLTIGETSWTDGRIRVTGTTVSGDERIDAFVSGVPERIDATVSVDTTGLVVNDISQLVNDVQAQINAVVAQTPITFAPLEATIEPASDSVLVEVAALLDQLGDTRFEVVGHTDNVGDDQENLVLSQDRAQAVVDRLVELGVSPERMSSRGEGDTKPIGDNGTNAGRAANRRIEFVLVGTSGG